MGIYIDVKLQGARYEIVEKALVDTGAEISLIPLRVARHIGAWLTNYQTNVVGIHGQMKTLSVIVAKLYFPQINHIGGQFLFAMSNIEQELIIGMDILKPLGIVIDTKTHQLSVKNEVWEAFKKLAGIGIVFFGGMKLLEALSEQTEE